jgi:hypothetical protein
VADIALHFDVIAHLRKLRNEIGDFLLGRFILIEPRPLNRIIWIINNVTD